MRKTPVVFCTVLALAVIAAIALLAILMAN